MRISINSLRESGIHVEITEDDHIELHVEHPNKRAVQYFIRGCDSLNLNDGERDQVFSKVYDISIMRAIRIASGG